MRPARLRHDELARLSALRSTGLLDTLPEPGFDDLTALAAQLCGTPIALVSLVDEARQWFKSHHGLAATETPREIAFCAHAILDDGVFVVSDAREDERFADNPLVTGEPHVVAYAGAPLVTGDAHALGTLCVIDHVRRDFSPEQLGGLRALARHVMQLVELRGKATALTEANRKIAAQAVALREREERFRSAFEGGAVGMAFVGLDGRYLRVNARWCEILGYGEAELLAKTALDVTHPDEVERARAALRAAATPAAGALVFEKRFVRKDGQTVWVQVSTRCLFDPAGAPLHYITQFQDVTARRTAEAEQASFFRLSIDLLAIVGADGYFRRLNPAWERVLGLPITELLARPCLELVHPEDRPATSRELARLGAGGHTSDFETRVRAQDGSHRWLLWSASGEAGGAIYVVARDVTDRKVAEQRLLARDALTQLLEQGRTLRDVAPRLLETLCGAVGWDAGALWEVDEPSGALWRVGVAVLDPSVADALGVVDRAAGPVVRGQGTLGRAWSTAQAQRGSSTDEGRPRRDTVAIPIVAGGEVLGALELFRREGHADGTSFDSVVGRRGGRPDESLDSLLEVVVSRLAHFITRARAETTRGRLVAVLEGSTDLVALSDASGRLQYMNRAGRRLLGIGDEESLAGATMADCHAEASRDLLRGEGIPTAMQSGAWSADATLLARDGGEIPVSELVIAHVDADGAPEFVSTVARDIRERRALERMKNEFVSTVSHELRTPLTSIRGGLGLVAGGAVGEIPPQARELVRIAHANCERLVRLVNEILDLERMETGKLVLDVQSVGAAVVVAEALETVAGFATGADVRLVCDLRAHDACDCDRDRIVQVLTNLLSNAVKFSPRGACVTVRVTRQSDALRFEVVDEGPGIAPQDAPKLFRPFQQLDGSDARRAGGTGLGLAISKAIVEQHGGAIGVRHEARGCVFWFQLPTPDGRERAAAPEVVS